MRRVTTLIVGALLTTLVLAACGGGGDKRLTKAEFIKAADEICKAANAELDQLGSPATPEEFSALVPKAIEIQRGVIDGIRKLEPPKADEDTLNALFDQVAEITDSIDKDPTVLMNATESPYAEPDKAAQDYGFKDCGSD